MKLVFTTEALADLDDILDYIAIHYPAVSRPFRSRLDAVLARIERWPESAQEVSDRPGVRVAPLIRYPYKVFYQLSDDAIEILHIHHTARE
jgi:plasmid stabilization system protein ParE